MTLSSGGGVFFVYLGFFSFFGCYFFYGYLGFIFLHSNVALPVLSIPNSP